MEFNHTECARAWAKVLAYKRCGDEKQAAEWWAKLSAMLGYDMERAEPAACSHRPPEFCALCLPGK